MIGYVPGGHNLAFALAVILIIAAGLSAVAATVRRSATTTHQENR